VTQTIRPAPVRKTVTVRASPETAFRVFTADMGRWWPRTHKIGQVEMVTTVVEPQAGGRWYEVGVDGSERPWGNVLAWDPPGHLLLAWRLNAQWQYDPDLLTEVEVRFTAIADGQTRVDFEHRGFENMGPAGDDARGRVDSPNGWGALLAAYKTLLEA